uniref:Bifunctional inhibitor/plant lipid transfer protein/seed storage helical domain-containing protein n=1 Tax=Oryza glumipatula TaxID=40148 RepID=A0A0E0AJT4_9ORYZ
MQRGAATAMPTLLMTIFLVALVSGGRVASQPQPQEAPAPAPEGTGSSSGACTAVLAKLADCVQYATAGSPLRQPPGSCCTEVERGVKDPAAVGCVCTLLAGNTYGLPLNLTRAAGLPAACGAPPTALSNCNVPSPKGGDRSGSSPKSAATPAPITIVVFVATVAAVFCYL